MYTITKSFNDGWVAVGNNSNNFDDSYFVEIYSDCALLAEYTSGYENGALIYGANQVWNNDMKIGGEVVIMDGFTLTIDGAVIEFASEDQLGQYCGIKVEPGGRLILKNGAKLTNLQDCPDMWRGVEVQGNPTEQQYEQFSGGVQKQGRVDILSGSIVENSKFGVYAATNNGEPGKFDPLMQSGGGIIIAENSTFRNNGRDNFFAGYSQIYPPSQQVYYNRSSFSNVVFETTQYPLSDPIVKVEEHIKLYGIENIRFLGCDFKNTSSNLSSIPRNERGTGIFAFDATFSVAKLCTTNVAPCAGIIPKFAGLENGIRATGIGGSYRTFKTVGADFQNNGMAIVTNNVNNCIIETNTISVPSPYSYPGTPTNTAGILLANSAGYNVEGNVISGPGAVVGTIGIWNQNNGSPANMVYRNYFGGLRTMVLAQGKNFSTDKQAGLEYRCNQFAYSASTSPRNIVVSQLPNSNAEYGIGYYQGFFASNQQDKIPADNQFSPSNGQGSHIWNSPGTLSKQINYYYRNNVGAQIYKPTQLLGNIITQNLNFSFSSSLCSGKAIGTGVKSLSTISDLLVIHHTQFNDNLYTLSQLIDGGDSEGMKYQIESAFPSEALELRDDLLRNSPYLSTDVLYGVADNLDVLPASFKLQIFTANPQCAGDEDFIEYLSGNEIIPEYMIEILLDYKNVITYRDDILNKIAQNLDSLNYYNVLYTANAFVNEEKDSIDVARWRYNQESLTTVQSGFDVINYALSIKNYDLANSVLNSMPSTKTLSDSVDIANWEATNSLITGLGQLNYNTSYDTLGINLVNSNLWYLPSETKALQAICNFAEFLGKYKNEYIYEEEDTMEQRSMVIVNKTNKNTAIKPFVQISPNPANRFITLEYPDLRFEEGLYLEIYSLNGSIVHKQRLSPFGMEVIEISNLSSSTYFCRVSNLKGYSLFTT